MKKIGVGQCPRSEEGPSLGKAELMDIMAGVGFWQNPLFIQVHETTLPVARSSQKQLLATISQSYRMQALFPDSTKS